MSRSPRVKPFAATCLAVVASLAVPFPAWTQERGDPAPTATPVPHPPQRPVSMPPGHPATSLPPGHAVPAMPPGHPPAQAPPPTFELPPVAAGAGTGSASLVWDSPTSWQPVTPANPMRRAQYRVPGPGGDAECVVFYFGPGQGGDARSNAARWASQFRQADGGDPLAAMKTREDHVGAITVLHVETSGTYLSGGMMGQPTLAKPEWGLLGAIVEGPDAHWFFKLTGPARTVESERAHFEQMIASLRPGG